VFSANSAEQSAITALVKDEARGDSGAVIGDITGCQASSSCRAKAGQLATALRRPGAVSVIQLQPSTSFSVAGTEGTARVAWDAGGSLPIVQCIRVRRTGNAISGLKVELLEVSRRIKSDTACPARF
jgi:hypothetical protein